MEEIELAKEATSTPLQESASSLGPSSSLQRSPVPCPSCGEPSAVSCPSCGTAAQPTEGPYVYAIGRIDSRFPRLSVEKEFVQATGRAETAGLTDSAAFQMVLSERQNRYLVRQLCWVLTINGVDSYILRPDDPADIDLLIDSLRPRPEPTDLDVVIGVRAGLAPPDMCNGLVLPVVRFHQIYSFDRSSLIGALPRPKGGPKDLEGAGAELLDRILLMTGNKGASATHRALNYLAVRYPPIYTQTARAFETNSALKAVEVRPSPLSSPGRQILTVIITYADRSTDVVSKYSVDVEMTDLFPHVARQLSPYFDMP